MPDTTPNLALPQLIAAQAQKHVTHNEALLALDALVQLAVLDRDLTAPPGSPGDGERWLVASPATGAWAGRETQIAAWIDGGWDFYEPNAGWLAYVADENALIAWNGVAWVPAVQVAGPALQNLSLLGVGTTADAANPLSAKLNNALWSARTVAEGGDGNLRYKLSKETAGKTLSFLFQDNFSGRAEFGLTGDDDFHLKVSADGTTWRDALVVNRSTGRASFPQNITAPELDLTLAELSLGVADALNIAQFLGGAGNRFADSFDALSYVDTAAASNLDTATAGVLKPSQAVTTIGTFTSASAGGRAVNSAAGLHAGFQFTATVTGKLSQARITITGYVSSGVYEARLYTNNSGAPGTQVGSASTALTIGANGNLTFTFPTPPNITNGAVYWLVFYNTGGSPSFSIDSCANSASYGSGRNTTLANMTTSDLPSLEDWRVEVSQAVPNNLTVASVALAAVAAPASAKLTARVVEPDSITLNTDLMFDVSRDGGTTWTAFTMAERFATPSAFHIIESNSLDISGQPAGTAVKWRARSANNKMLELHDVHLYWT